jgi:hypothetical protein
MMHTSLVGGTTVFGWGERVISTICAQASPVDSTAKTTQPLPMVRIPDPFLI